MIPVKQLREASLQDQINILSGRLKWLESRLAALESAPGNAARGGTYEPQEY